MASHVEHPYYPRDLELPHYVPNDKSVFELLGVFFGGVGLGMVVFWLYMGTKPHLKHDLGGKLKLCWFLACGFIHTFLEGYFSVRHRTLAGEQTFLAQCCEYRSIYRIYMVDAPEHKTEDPYL